MARCWKTISTIPLGPSLARKGVEIIPEGHPQTPGNPEASGLHTPNFISLPDLDARFPSGRSQRVAEAPLCILQLKTSLHSAATETTPKASDVCASPTSSPVL